MTVSTTTSEARFIGDGIASSFPLGFELLSASELSVSKVNTAGVISPLILNADYTVSGLGDESGATLTLTSTLANGELLLARRVTTKTQEASFLPSSGFNPSALGDALDKLTRAVQELSSLTSRSFRAPIGETTVDFPASSVRAGKTLIFDGAGQPTVGSVASTDLAVSLYFESLLSAPNLLTLQNLLEVDTRALQEKLLPSIDGNLIINGNFSTWQRGTSTTINGYGAADRWINSYSGGTVTQSRQTFPVGTKLGASAPRDFLRQSVTGQSLAAHRAHTTQRIEAVRSYSNGRITVLGWARRASGAGGFTVSARQNFGTGGSPSAPVNLPCGVVLPLTSEWAPFEAVIDLPSIAGKTLGTNGNNCLEIELWASAGADHPRAAVLGVQTIEIDFWGIHVLPGYYPASTALIYRERPFHEELVACERYYVHSMLVYWAGYSVAGMQVATTVSTPVTMRGPPTITLAAGGDISGNSNNVLSSSNSNREIWSQRETIATGFTTINVRLNIDAEI